MKNITFIFCLFSSALIAQTSILTDSAVNQQQNTMKQLVDDLFAAKTDSVKKNYNQQLLTAFENELAKPNSFSNGFDSLRKNIQVLYSPDNKFKIINWYVVKEDKTFEHYGFIQSKHLLVTKINFFKKKRTETIQLYPLIDKSNEIRNPENTISDNKKWFGMLYYKIIIKKTKAKTYYTLFGLDENDRYSIKKIIDVLSFDDNGKPRFGADIFVMDKKYPKRVIFEYSSNCTMSLRYNVIKDSIVFDHLAPTQPQLIGQYQYYCTDMSYDGFGFKNGKWNYGTDLNVVNEKEENDKYYNDPKNPTYNIKSNSILPSRKKKK